MRYLLEIHQILMSTLCSPVHQLNPDLRRTHHSVTSKVSTRP